ncbi:MAG: hypothetical protein AAF518_16435 [Spirochaetota bacterium]
MQPKIPQILSILQEVCSKYGYSWKLIDDYSNNLVEISNGKKSFFTSNNRVETYPLNLQFASQVVKDKAWCYRILKQKGFRIPKGEYFFVQREYRDLRGDGRELEDAIAFAKNTYPIFVKPNDRSLGTLANIIYSEAELLAHLKKIAENSWIAHIQELINLPEYRIFAIDGEVEFIYQKTPPQILGDGNQSIEELLNAFNQNCKNPKHRISLKDSFLQKQLEQFHFTKDSILRDREILAIASINNLTAGGGIADYRADIPLVTKNWVREITDAMSIRVCGIDIFVENGIDDPSGYIVIELNHNPGLSGFYNTGYEKKVTQVLGKILKKYFNTD